MNANTTLTATQRQILEHALDHTGGRITWFPESIKGGARTKVLDSLLKRSLILAKREGHTVAAIAYDALNRPRPVRARNGVALEAAPAPRMRQDSKQAQVIALLQRLEGATIEQMMHITDWQSHTVRGFLAGSLKKKLELNVTSSKAEGKDRVYRIESSMKSA